MTLALHRHLPSITQARASWRSLRRWPWMETLRTLRARFREDHLSLTASSLTFTTLIALVPLLTVMLAVFSAFPMFASFEGALERYFLQALVPDSIARPVLRSLTQFASQASRMGSLGLMLFGLTALTMIFTIDRTLNAIWRVPRARPLAQRVLVYWAALTLGPLALGVSLTMMSYAITASSGLVGVMPGGLRWLLRVTEFVLLCSTVAGLFHYVPNTFVRWRHAWAGALVVAVGLEAAKAALAWYLRSVPTYSMVYGAFATVPILLLWIYLAWVIVLLGAVIAAYAPSLQMGLRRPAVNPGQTFDLALLILRELQAARSTVGGGRRVMELAGALAIDPLMIDASIEALTALGWVARIAEPGEQRSVILCDPSITPAMPLIHALLIDPAQASPVLRRAAALDKLTLQQVLDAQ